MMINRVPIVLLFFLNLNNTLGWDGCDEDYAWRCGDTCINGWPGQEAKCKCGDEIITHRAQKWCCNDKPCEGRGEKATDGNFWHGEEDKEWRKIGAECSGTALKLDEPCNGTCNDHQEDHR